MTTATQDRCPVEGCDSTDYPHDPDDHGHANPCGCDWTWTCGYHAIVNRWTDAETAALAEAMSDAAHARRDAWMNLRAMAAARVRWHVGEWYRLDPTTDPRTIHGHPGTLLAIAASAAAYGLVPNPLDPDARARYDALGDVWRAVPRARAIDAGTADRHLASTTCARWYEDHDGFDEMGYVLRTIDSAATDAFPPVYRIGWETLRDAARR